ncbi:hypothetical protein DdX_10721 [Ditylenchus destructor]|uniref:Uncharacterized protein n=1 Tax=Ditylenchus destructor TaxID=166010 RepID=A0AAD4N3S2_9BILA|nr:hypothetical protein DdX_10721 [Ditylenchus destructor]
MPVASDYRMQAFYWRNANPAYIDTALPFLLQLDDEYEDAVDEEEEQEPTLIKKEIHMDTEGSSEGRGRKLQAADDDRTEDQVPDITGTTEDKDAEPTSMADVEDLPPVETEGEQPEEENAGAEADQAEVSQAESGAEIPVNVFDEGAGEEQPPAEASEEPVAEEAVEEEPAAEEPAAEQEAEQPEEIPVEQFEEAAAPEEPAAEPEAEAEEPVAEEAAVESSQPSTPAAVTAEPVENGVPGTPRTPASAVGEEQAVPSTPKSPGSVRRSSNVSSGTVPKSPLMPNGTVQPGTPKVENDVSSPAPQTPKSGARTPRSGAKAAKGSEFVFEKSESPPAQPRTPKRTTFEDEQENNALSPTKSPTKRRSKSPRSPKKKSALKSAAGDEEPAAEPVSESVSESVQDEAPPAAEEEIKDVPVEVSDAEAPAAEEQVNDVTEAPPADESETAQEEVKVTPAEGTEEAEAPSSPPPVRTRRESPSPPPRGREGREPAARDYVPYDQDSHKEPVPPRLPTSTSFSSYSPPERTQYQSISPWVSTAGKYRNEYTVGMAPVASTPYTSLFDDIASTGPFSSSLYATSRLLERSRSRTRERRNAMRSQRSASNYYRFASQYPAPLRTRDYSTPPSAAVSRAPSRAGSFISFMDYAGKSHYDLVRNPSRGSLYDSTQALSRSTSHGIDYFLGGGRISRVDSFVNNLNSRYEWGVPSTYENYRSASRGQVPYTPMNDYSSHTNYPHTYRENGYQDHAYQENIRNLRRWDSVQRSVRDKYEARVDDLQRSLSRERYARDNLRSKYTQTAYQLEQACKQMDLLRSSSYSNWRSGSQPRTSVYSHFYPYY